VLQLHTLHLVAEGMEPTVRSWGQLLAHGRCAMYATTESKPPQAAGGHCAAAMSELTQRQELPRPLLERLELWYLPELRANVLLTMQVVRTLRALVLHEHRSLRAGRRWIAHAVLHWQVLLPKLAHLHTLQVEHLGADTAAGLLQRLAEAPQPMLRLLHIYLAPPPQLPLAGSMEEAKEYTAQGQVSLRQWVATLRELQPQLRVEIDTEYCEEALQQ